MESAQHRGDVPPVHTIDLSLPPIERYVQVAQIYRPQLLQVTYLFDELVESILPGYLPWIKWLARLALRRLSTQEETDELRGISRVTGIEMYLLVSLNVLLDLLMGCTSGAALAKDSKSNNQQPRLLHFRTLDWGMDALRQLLVCFEFVQGLDSSSVVATNITYVGFVGVLTGVRKGLSVSLNFRPNHNSNGWIGNLRYYGSLLLVLLGLRRSISSVLRQYIIPSGRPGRSWFHCSIWPIVQRTPSTAAYLTFCDGVTAVVLEKDHRTARMASSQSFIVATNSDHISTSTEDKHLDEQHSGATLVASTSVTMADLIEDSRERRECIQARWDKKVYQARRVTSTSKAVHARNQVDRLRRTRASQRHQVRPSEAPMLESDAKQEVTATSQEVVDWTTAYPTTNEMTHFAVVMDPSEGRVLWIRRYLEPLPFDLTEFV
ncbi:hypothetical protein EYZ11_006753 [Aspergillus tanneri]|uniref:ceramidase n=1 Tax=Aspergillus tanneri TaxID=1220188 RepID=A0A4S3JEP1_9EURO|nr:hypothetical protein EYZ11_006753 [Aspergillus tanneri]